MKRAFMCSLCRNGILGGALYVDDSSVTYRTNKLTVDRRYRNLVLPRSEIVELAWKGITATFRMADGENYSFLIFNKSGFVSAYEG